VFRDCPDCPQMVVIPGGSFLMGSPEGEAARDPGEGPQRAVSVASFALGRTHVTRGEFAVFVRETGHDPQGCAAWSGSRWVLDPVRNWRHPGFAQADDHPVVCVNWDDARRYAQWLSDRTGYRYFFPSEAQWEYAARAGSGTARYWGDDPAQACDFANVDDQPAGDPLRAHPSLAGVVDPGAYPCRDGYAYTSPVARFRPNGFGLYDMLGNAWQWTRDCWNRNYRGAPPDEQAWTGGDCARRVFRGGAWSLRARFVRAAIRQRGDTGTRHDNLGFRLVRPLP
jgi:formylglycine-generating enzyme